MKDPIFSRLLELHPKFSDLSLIRIKKLLKKLKFDENKSNENISEIQKISDKSEEVNIDDKKIVAEIKPISKEKTEAS